MLIGIPNTLLFNTTEFNFTVHLQNMLVSLDKFKERTRELMNLKALVPAKTPDKYDLCTLKRRGVLATHYPSKTPDLIASQVRM